MCSWKQALAERLQMLHPEAHLEELASGSRQGLYSKEKAVEGKAIHYLADCYTRALAEKVDSKVRATQVRYHLFEHLC